MNGSTPMTLELNIPDFRQHQKVSAYLLSWALMSNLSTLWLSTSTIK